jgi:hypothetical protein
MDPSQCISANTQAVYRSRLWQDAVTQAASDLRKIIDPQRLKGLTEAQLLELNYCFKAKRLG